jgi:carboxyl-terminal processing protease
MKRWVLYMVMGWSAAIRPCLAEEPVTVPTAEFAQLLESYQHVLSAYVEPADGKKLFTEAIRGMVASLDPHSRYLDKDDLDDLERIQSGRYVGIGVEVEPHNGQILIHAVSENGPADRAGIRPGDSIIAIDGAPLFGLREGQIGSRMRGAPGSRVEVTLARRGATPLRTLRIVRASLQGSTVSVQRLAGDIARIRISEFGGATAAELLETLRQLDGARQPKGLVLDLRNNPGGLLAAAVATAGAFLPEGAVVFSSAGRAPDTSSTVTVPWAQAGEEESSRLPPFARTVPLVVLVNAASASGAELVAGALQDHGRGKVVGARTYGKGSIQTVFRLSEESAIKLTIARYFTPKGHEVQARGITPDVAVAPAPGGDEIPLLREADMVNHLAPDTVADAANVPTPPTPAERPVAEDSRSFGGPADRALQTALARLRGPSTSGHAAAAIRRGIAGMFKLRKG